MVAGSSAPAGHGGRPAGLGAFVFAWGLVVALAFCETCCGPLPAARSTIEGCGQTPAGPSSWLPLPSSRRCGEGVSMLLEGLGCNGAWSYYAVGMTPWSCLHGCCSCSCGCGRVWSSPACCLPPKLLGHGLAGAGRLPRLPAATLAALVLAALPPCNTHSLILSFAGGPGGAGLQGAAHGLFPQHLQCVDSARAGGVWRGRRHPEQARCAPWKG